MTSTFGEESSRNSTAADVVEDVGVRFSKLATPDLVATLDVWVLFEIGGSVKMLGMKKS